jgi:RNA polymerase sigma-70 factor (ECF subfamily)
MRAMTDILSQDSRATRSTLFLRLKQEAPANQVAWKEFHERYAPIIRGFARRMGAKPQDVDDVVQDVLTGFYAVSPEFTYDAAQGSFRGYLRTCTWRKLQARLGSRLRIGGRSIGEIDSAALEVQSTWEDIWENEKLHRALGIVRIRYASRPDRLKTFRAFEMATILERPPEQIAAELNMPVASVHAAKARVSKALRETFEQLDASTG